MHASGDSSQVIARVGGISCDTVRCFHSDFRAHLKLIGSLEGSLQAKRAEMVECLYHAIHGADPDRRHALLAIKRDCYNGRPLAKYQGQPAWRFLEEAAGALGGQLLELEQRLEIAKHKFNAAYEQETDRQYRYLAGLLDEPALKCGLAIASPVVAAEVSCLRNKAPRTYGRKEKRLAATLLRYVSRAALKLSPFSTFTPVGLANLDPGRISLALLGTKWKRYSLVRLRRHILERCNDLLLLYSPWRKRMEVALNDSFTTLKDGRILYRRSGHYGPDKDTNKLRYHEESMVRVHLCGPLFKELARLLAGKTVPYLDLLAELQPRLSHTMTPAEICEQLEQLIDIGLLQLTPPWSDHDPYLEGAMLRELRRVPGDTVLDDFIARLERLVGLQEQFFTAPDALAVFQEMHGLIDSLITSAARIASLPPAMDVSKLSSTHDIYQDIWCASTDQANRAVVSAPRMQMEEALSSTEPLIRYSRIYDHRLDFLYTLGEFLRKQHGELCQVPVIEVFESSKILWQQYVKFFVDTRETAHGWRNTWNPLALESLQELAWWRDAVHNGLSSCLTDGEAGRRISGEGLNELLKSLPQRFIHSHVGACLFLQPASYDGSLWMLNRMKEGTGRFGSRYTSVMPDDVVGRYTAALMQRGTFEIDGEQVPLLDVYSVRGDTVNVHLKQTAKVLTLPGEHVTLPANERIRLKDLLVTLNAKGLPEVRDRRGQRYLPVHLGGGFHDYLPTLVKFLCAFGPTEFSGVFPPPLLRRNGDVAIQERTLIGNVIIHRKSWSVPAAKLDFAQDQCSDSEMFAAVHDWRNRYSIPEQVFAIERVPHPVRGFRYQPQYMDFTSPLFVPIWRAISTSAGESLSLVETLPAPDMFPRDADGKAWAVELLLDSLALRPYRPASQAHVADCGSVLTSACSHETDVCETEGGQR